MPDDGTRRARPRGGRGALTAASVWRREPFRLFFPLGVVLGWLGVGHWLLYTTGVTATYSCLGHGLAQVEGFLPAFALGFLLTALPRRTQGPPAGLAVVVGGALALSIAALAAVVERVAIAQGAFIAGMLLLVGFAARRLATGAGRRRPPANFVLIPIGLLHGLGGAALILVAELGGGAGLGLGRLLVEQGMFLCLVIGVAALLVPLMSGDPPPADLDASAGERRKAIGWAALGAGLFASLLAEHAGSESVAPGVRAALVAWGLGWRGPQRLLARPGLHRRLMWLALHLTPLGIGLAAAAPDYRVPALHVTFIGGFGLMAFAVASHVAYSHLGLERLREGRPAAVAVAGAGIVLAMLARVVADWSATYFAHIGWAATAWIAGTAVWLALLGRHLGREPQPGP